MSAAIKAPFPWFGGKSRVAAEVWQAFGVVNNYIEPFFGSGAVMLGRPQMNGLETINDKDCWVANFWRAVTADPDAVAKHADWPVNEADLFARHKWLRLQLDMREAVRNDPNFYNARIAGWWAWGLSSWIGDNWCRTADQEATPHLSRAKGVHAQIPELRGHRGLHSSRPDLTGLRGVQSKIPNLTTRAGLGRMGKRPLLTKGTELQRAVEAPPHEKRPHINRGGKGVNNQAGDIYAWFRTLSDRLRRVRVCCGDWARICTPAVLGVQESGHTGIFLDPPYSSIDRAECYNEESFVVSHEVRDWCLKQGTNPRYRIALCGYAGEHEALEAHGWRVHLWKAHGGYANARKKGMNANRHRERIWFSPACLDGANDLFAEVIR